MTKERLTKLDVMTLGMAARELSRTTGQDVETWMIRKLFERKILPEPLRLGLNRIISARDLPTVRRLLEQVGYLKTADNDRTDS